VLGTLPVPKAGRKPNAGSVVSWTDDYPDIVGAMLRKKLGR
jgi:hypothetical protein